MKKLFFMVLLIMICYSSVGGMGIPQKDQLIYNYVQLKIVNLSDAVINFYFNDLRIINTRLNIGQEETTYKVPVTDDYPGFFAINRGNDGLEIYTTSYIGEIAGEFYYLILVYNDRIDFYRMLEKGVFDTNDNYLNLLETRRHNFSPWSWRKLELSENNITIEVQNMTGELITINSTGYLFRENRIIVGEGTEDRDNLHLENEARCLYVINNEIFSLKYISFTVYYSSLLSYPNRDQTGYGRPRDTISINNLKRRNITIIINGYDVGYEIRFE